MKPERIQLVADDQVDWTYLEPVVGLHRRYVFAHADLAAAFAVYCRQAAATFGIQGHADARGAVLDVIVLPDESTEELEVRAFLRATSLRLDDVSDEATRKDEDPARGPKAYDSGARDTGRAGTGESDASARG